MHACMRVICTVACVLQFSPALFLAALLGGGDGKGGTDAQAPGVCMVLVWGLYRLL